MRRKPDDRLQWLEKELLAAEYDETRENEDLEDEEVLLDPEDPDYMDDEIDESAAVFVDPREERKKKKEKAGLVFMALVTLGLIGMMVRWWLQWHN